MLFRSGKVSGGLGALQGDHCRIGIGQKRLVYEQEDRPRSSLRDSLGSRSLPHRGDPSPVGAESNSRGGDGMSAGADERTSFFSRCGSESPRDRTRRRVSGCRFRPGRVQPSPADSRPRHRLSRDFRTVPAGLCSLPASDGHFRTALVTARAGNDHVGSDGIGTTRNCDAGRRSLRCRPLPCDRVARTSFDQRLTCGPVDPNRNFGTYQFWNSVNNGSSTDPCNGGSGTYRGTLPFSELETQNIKAFVNSRNFKTAFSAHTYGNYLIKPWCWQDPIGTPDDAMYNMFLSDMQATNGYTIGFPSQTVGYKVRGGTDDWYYNDSGHAKIFSFTPETGASFWPAQSEIIPLAQGMLYSNQYIALIAGPYVNPTSKAFNLASYTPGQAGTYKVKFRNKGIMAANNVKVILTPLNANVTIPTQQFTYPSIAPMASDSTTFNFTVSGAAPNNCGIPVVLTIKLDTTTIYSSNEYILVGAGTVTLNDNASSFSNWTTSNTWNTTTSQFVSSPSSFTDSPTGNYGNNVNNSMTLSTAVNVSTTPVVFLSFWHRYATEPGFDFCYVEVSSNNGTTWQQVASYNGSMTTWTQQTFDITQYAGASTQLKLKIGRAHV